MSTPTPPPGWYPAPHAGNEQRYWDGARWVEAAATTATLVPGPKKGIGIAALIVGIVAFLTGLFPVVGILLGVTAVALGIVALVRKQPKSLAITAIVLGAIATLVSLVMTIGFGTLAANLPQSSPDPKPVATQSADAVEPDPEPTSEATPEPPPAPTTPDLSTFVETDDRNWALIAKDPDAHAGVNVILYGSITQFDSATGRCAMLISTAGTVKEYSYEYDQNTMAMSGDGDTQCPAFDPLIEDDHVKIWASVVESFSYDTQIGGNTTVPLIEVWQVELLPAPEF